MSGTDDPELEQLLQVLQPYLRDPEKRRRLEAAGVQVLAADFYSAVPTAQEIEQSFEYRDGAVPYLDGRIFDDVAMAKWLEALCVHAGEFHPPIDGDRRNPAGFFWDNPAFTLCDAMAYYCTLRQLRPRKVLEIGSGFSTLVALEALERNGSGTITCIEPYPRPFLRDRRGVIDLVETKAEQLGPAFFQQTLADGDVLFIDSTHTVKAGGDCVYLFLTVLPQIARELMVHVHDIFLPMAYPKPWLLRENHYWTEQYLLHALLLGNAAAQVRYGTVYHQLIRPQRLEQMMGGQFPLGGSSFWFGWKPLAPPAANDWPPDLPARAAAYNAAEPSSVPRPAEPAKTLDRTQIPRRPARGKIPAAGFDATRGAVRGVDRVEALDDGDWLCFCNVDFADGVAMFHAEIACPAHKAGQHIELHLDAPDGPLLGRLEIAATGGWEVFVEQAAPLMSAQGVHDLYLLIRGYYGAGNLKQMWFS